jgi:hypothetical protein
MNSERWMGRDKTACGRHLIWCHPDTCWQDWGVRRTKERNENCLHWAQNSERGTSLNKSEVWLLKAICSVWYLIHELHLSHWIWYRSSNWVQSILFTYKHNLVITPPSLTPLWRILTVSSAKAPTSFTKNPRAAAISDFGSWNCQAMSFTDNWLLDLHVIWHKAHQFQCKYGVPFIALRSDPILNA